MNRFWMWAALFIAATLTLVAVATADAQAQARSGGTAVLRGLDKVTGHARDFNAPIGQAVMFGTLEVTARACEKRPEDQTPEVSIYLQIVDTAPSVRRAERGDEDGDRRQIFSGWMFASSPGLNGLEHPVYDVWAMDCRT